MRGHARLRTRAMSWTFLAIACHAPGEPSLGAAMLGEWSYASPVVRTPPALNTGLHVTIVVESTSADRFAGRVLQWFAGDVGISPDAFGPVTGTVAGDGSVNLRPVVDGARRGRPDDHGRRRWRCLDRARVVARDRPGTVLSRRAIRTGAASRA